MLAYITMTSGFGLGLPSGPSVVYSRGRIGVVCGGEYDGGGIGELEKIYWSGTCVVKLFTATDIWLIDVVLGLGTCCIVMGGCNHEGVNGRSGTPGWRSGRLGGVIEMGFAVSGVAD